MKRFLTLIVSVVIFMTMLTGTIGTVYAESSALTDEQKNAIAMLNHLTVLTQETNASKNSRILMEQMYASLINNIYPNAVDSRTLSQLTGLLDIMEQYRMIDVKRERLQLIYEQNQAKAIRAAIPHPLGFRSIISQRSPVRLIASIVYMAVDSYTSYTAYAEENELQYLQDGWALDDEEAAMLHESRKRAFSYMIAMVNDYGLPGELALTESTVSELVKWKNNDNEVSKILFLESNKKIYESYGGYWLILADAYYRHKDYEKCIDAINTYETMGTHLFRWDYEYAKALPLAIASAVQVYSDEEYVEYAVKSADAIVENTQTKDWALRYFAAQTYIDAFGKSEDKKFLRKAYNIVLENVNYLVNEQRTMNETYLSPIKEAVAQKDDTNSEKEQIKNYNKMIKEKRIVECSPVLEALEINCELLFDMADELQISEADRTKVDMILHPDGNRIFLNEAIDDKFWFDATHKADTEPMEIVFGGTSMVLPTRLLSENAEITVSVKEKNSDMVIAIKDWKLDKIERGTEGDISTFAAIFTSEEAKKHTWGPDSDILIIIKANPSYSEETVHFSYTTDGTKKAWYDYFKVWEGHKNNWFDYLRVWDNSVNFVRVQ